MKRFFRNYLIIVAVEIAAFALASLDAIPFLWKLQVMFIGGIAAGAVVCFLDERDLLSKIDMLQRIRKNLNIED